MLGRVFWNFTRPSFGTKLLRFSAMSSSQQFDCIVLGSGQAGTPLAGAYAKAGKKTALVERVHIGGCCVNEGCTPTKTMIASGRVSYLTRRAADYGVHVPAAQEDGKISIDMKKIRQRKRDIVTSFRGGNESRTQSARVQVFMGEASFKDSKTISVKLNDGSETTISSDTIFINTGERPARPPIEGLADVPPELILDSTSIMELDEVPSHLIILGGGYIALEFGQLFRRLGAAVTVVQRNKQLVPREDPELAESLLKILTEDGLTVELNASATKVAKSAGGTIQVTVKASNGEEEAIVGSHVLLAVGRTPNSDSLNLEAAGIKTSSRGYIEHNEYLETSVPGIYVLGDVKGPPAFTHISYDDFRIVQANVLEKKEPKKSITDRFVPYVVFTDPQLGHVGLHEHEARAKFPEKKIKTAKMPMTWVARALETDETRGMMKAVVDAESGQILGFSCLGIDGGEIMSMVQTAMMGKLPYQVLQDATWAHPALAESLNNIWGTLE